jgi:hypothetical protein
MLLSTFSRQSPETINGHPRVEMALSARLRGKKDTVRRGKSASGMMQKESIETKPPVYVFKPGPMINFQEIVMAIVNGLDVSTVSPELYPVLWNHLVTKQRALQGANPLGLAKVREALDYMSKPKEPERVKPVVHRERKFSPSKQLVDDALVSALENRCDDIDPLLLDHCLGILRGKRKKHLESGKYRKAELVESGIRNILDFQMQQEVSDKENEKLREDSSRLQFAQIQLENTIEKWEMLIGDQRQQLQDSLDRMREDFARELEELDARFTQDIPFTMAKPSSMVLDLRARQKKLAVVKQWQEAIKVRDMADKLENQELERKRSEWRQKLVAERLQLIEKEKQMERVREMACQAQLAKSQLAAQQEISHAEKVVELWKRRLGIPDDPKLEKLPRLGDFGGFASGGRPRSSR